MSHTRSIPDSAPAPTETPPAAGARCGKAGRCLPGDAEENRSPAAHAAFRPLFVIVRGDEQQVGEVAAGGHFLPVVSDHLLGAGDLFPGRQQPFAIKKRPPVELAGGQLNVIGFQLNAQLDNFIELVDVVPVENEVEHHRVVARFHCFGHGQLLLEGFCCRPARR